jgi:hypothetical protein
MLTDKDAREKVVKRGGWGMNTEYSDSSPAAIVVNSGISISMKIRKAKLSEHGVEWWVED